MAAISILLSGLVLPSIVSSEIILAAYIFHRHGDRTSKSTPPTSLTDLGYQQVYTSGSYFRDRYVTSTTTTKIAGLNPDQVKLSQLSISAPQDNVLMSSATGFSQALYPPIPESSERLRNGTIIRPPMNGYQIIPVSTVSTGGGSEDSGWLQDSTDCGAAETSSNQYFSSPEYTALADSTAGFYQRLAPVLNSTFSASQTSFKNAYTIYDYLNVANIHNASIPSSDLLDDATLFQLRTLADQHELGLAYNASDNARSIAGMQLAAQVVDFFSASVAKSSAPKLGVQFGAYATFQSFFGLSGLLDVFGSTGTTDEFHGIPDYASAMVWELYTLSSYAPSYPLDSKQLNIRFLFHNGTTSNNSRLVNYPLFGISGVTMSWDFFVSNVQKFAVGTTEKWCDFCGNSTGVCAQYASGSSSSSGEGGVGSTKGSHMSNAVAGVVGAMVTLAVIFLVEALLLLLGGFRLVNKKKLVGKGEPSLYGTTLNGAASGRTEKASI